MRVKKYIFTSAFFLMLIAGPELGTPEPGENLFVKLIDT